VAPLPFSDATKEPLLVAAVSWRLFGCRATAANALRRGLTAVLGADLLSSLTPEQLGLRLRGYEPLPQLELSSRVNAACAFIFHETDWDEPSVLRAYKVWGRVNPSSNFVIYIIYISIYLLEYIC